MLFSQKQKSSLDFFLLAKTEWNKMNFWKVGDTCMLIIPASQINWKLKTSLRQETGTWWVSLKFSLGFENIREDWTNANISWDESK